MMDAALARAFGLDASELFSDEEILRALEEQLGALLRTDPMRLVQILYRMDVDERAVEIAMEDANSAEGLARLILQRTRLKAATRAAFRPSSPSPDDADLTL